MIETTPPPEGVPDSSGEGMTKQVITLEIDPPVLFDAVQRVGNDAAGNRMLELLLSASTGKVGLGTQLGAGLYGISVLDHYESRTTPAQPKDGD